MIYMFWALSPSFYIDTEHFRLLSVDPHFLNSMFLAFLVKHTVNPPFCLQGILNSSLVLEQYRLKTPKKYQKYQCYVFNNK